MCSGAQFTRECVQCMRVTVAHTSEAAVAGDDGRQDAKLDDAGVDLRD